MARRLESDPICVAHTLAGPHYSTPSKNEWISASRIDKGLVPIADVNVIIDALYASIDAEEVDILQKAFFFVRMDIE